jgi:hypothetical protein
MKKLLVVGGMLVILFLVGCLAPVAERAQRNRDAFAGASFDTRSRQVGAEHGMIIIDVENESADPALLKITLVEQPDAWTVFEIPGQETVQIELGATAYTLQLVEEETGAGASDTLHVSDDAAITITNGFDIFVPSEN